MQTYRLPWNKIFEKLEKFYYRWIYDFEALRSRVEILCCGCGQAFAPDHLLGAPTMGHIGRVFVITDSPDIELRMKLSQKDPNEWTCPRCQNNEIQCSWSGPLSESYRMTNLIEGNNPIPSHLLPPSEKDWQFLASDTFDVLGVLTPLLAFSPVADILATTSYFSLFLWDPISGQKVELQYDQEDRFCNVIQILYSPDGEKIALVGCGFKGSSAEHTTWIRMWNLCPRIHVWHESWAWGWPTAAALSPDGSIIAIGSQDGSIRLVDFANGSCLAQRQGFHTKAVLSILFEPNMQHIFTCGEDGFRMCNYDFNSPITLTEQPIHRVMQVPNKELLLLQGKTINSVWDATGPKPKQIKEYVVYESGGLGELNPDDCPGLSPDGRFIAWGWGPDIALLDLHTNQIVRQIDLRDTSEWAEIVVFSANGGLLALSGGPPIWIWHVGALR